MSLFPKVCESDCETRISDLEALLTAAKARIAELESEADQRESTVADPDVISLDPEPVHLWFELSYAHYLTVPRSALQSMPIGWQQRFVRCLEELDDKIDWRPKQGRYQVQLRSGSMFLRDPLMDYERGRRRLPVKS